MKIKLLAFAGLLSILALGTLAPASAIEVGVTNTTSNTVTSGHLSICQVDNHWDAGIQEVFQTSGDLQLQAGGGGQKGLGGSLNFGGNGVGLGGSIFGDGLRYVEVSGNGEVSYTEQVFVDHNVTDQEFSGQQTTSSITTSSATFTNF
jgi:hypothetical protein